MTARKTAKKADEVEKTGVEYARDIEAALDFYRQQYPSEWLDEQNYPFAHHVETVIARLQNK